jgi:hypothetical protein
MKLLGGSNDEGPEPGSNRPQMRTSDDAAAAVAYGFHPQENEFPPAAFVPKRWTGADDIVEVRYHHHLDFIVYCTISSSSFDR